MTTTAVGPTPVCVPLDQVETELARQIAGTRGDADEPIRFARMSNLVVYCNCPEDVDRVRSLIPEIVDRHPARVILLMAAEGGTEPTGEVMASVLVRPLDGDPAVM